VFYERELRYRLKRLTDMFEPAIILVVGGMVAFVAVAQIAEVGGLVGDLPERDLTPFARRRLSREADRRLGARLEREVADEAPAAAVRRGRPGGGERCPTDR